MKEIIKTDQAPAAIGPYSQAVKIGSGKIVYCSGQIALDPRTATIVSENVAEQCQQVMKNIKAVLAAAGGDFGNVVKTTIYLVDMADFSAVNEIYGACFDSNPPARATVAVSGLPMNVLVEIEAIAVI